MADDDEIDILGDFSFNSCLAQNNQGIPSCSNREDTVHPQWLLDSTATNWYDTQSKHSYREKEVFKKLTKSPLSEDADEVLPIWNKQEREMLIKEMGKYGRNVRKISEILKTKTEAEIQAFIEAEFGVNLDTPTFGLEKHEDDDEVPAVVQEEIVTDDCIKVLNVQTKTRKPYQKKTYNTKSKNVIPKSKPILIDNTSNFLVINESDILYEDDLTIGSTESIGSDVDSTDIVSKNMGKFQKAKISKRIVGSNRRKGLRNNEKGKARNSSKDLLKSPQGRVRKDSSLSEDSAKSPKMHIVLGSGQALTVSEGEQVITIKKKKDSDPESDIDVDVDSESETKDQKAKEKLIQPALEEPPVAVPIRKFEPMPRRQKKLNLAGSGGCTIIHTESGDLYEIASEPRKERQPRKQPIQLIPCRFYSADKPAPFSVVLHVSALVSADVHAHTSRAEVMGLLGGRSCEAGDRACGMGDRTCERGGRPALHLAVYRPAAAAASRTHCDMDPVSQAAAAEAVCAAGGRAAAWHHSHPRFGASPSATDLRTQAALQRALRPAPFLGLVTSQHWPPGRTASHYRCIRVEDDVLESEDSIPAGYQLNVRLAADLTSEGVSTLLADLTDIRAATLVDEYAVDMNSDVCPEANMTYLDKCISSITHHMRSAGYKEDDVVTRQLLQGIRDVFR